MIDPAAVMRHHTPCKAGHDKPLCFGCGHTAEHPCEPYQVAEALEEERQRVQAVARVLNDDNRLDNEHSVAALGLHVPKVQQLLTDLWRALGAVLPTDPHAHTEHGCVCGGHD